ncbi:hypothetical protein COV24_02410 [candidate division WWE3 bacterium CG10_big_fil_rev_8_21_14_0_10_32_10]|uniref:TNase-like domain-containing protein n=1 Tax=candidate division WWE3 bacterium CG10_big_fil_rev_8_21_14_0_10_32_10 TaxID=1975090 RepID=A0A2H0RCC3_UNCKA|nr:MAG: hypothetical protein COV24_02410 [candidate division WWE3 bacterium CG10_big_fil_rev_8_21_14_0_10_32_10]
MGIKTSTKIIKILIPLILLILAFIIDDTKQEKYYLNVLGTEIQKEYNQTNIAKTETKVWVSEVIDGDTIKVLANNKEETIRLIGINTPELNLKGCYAQKAKEWLSEKVLNKEVTLITDTSQGDGDKYERLLRYVFLEDININEQIIKNGFAKEYKYKTDYIYRKDFINAEEEAIKNNMGLWKDCEM